MIECRDYRTKTLSKKEEKCHCCGDENSDLVVHHLDGDRSNNSLSNLEPICHTCHSQIHNKDKQVAEYVKKLGYTPHGRRSNTIQVSEELADELHSRKQRGDSYEDVVWRLIEEEG